MPRWRPQWVAALAFLLLLGIECFKLTHLHDRWQSNPLVRFLLGTTFSSVNLACYAIAILVMAGIESIARKSERP